MQRESLVPRKPGAAKLLRRQTQYCVGLERSVNKSTHSAPNGRSSLARQLLVSDGTSEGFEMPKSVSARPDRAGVVNFDVRLHDRVTFRQLFHGRFDLG